MDVSPSVQPSWDTWRITAGLTASGFHAPFLDGLLPEVPRSRPAGDNVWRSMLATGSTMLAPLLGRTALRRPPIAGTSSTLKVPTP